MADNPYCVEFTVHQYYLSSGAWWSHSALVQCKMLKCQGCCRMTHCNVNQSHNQSRPFAVVARHADSSSTGSQNKQHYGLWCWVLAKLCDALLISEVFQCSPSHIISMILPWIPVYDIVSYKYHTILGIHVLHMCMHKYQSAGSELNSLLNHCIL